MAEPRRDENQKPDEEEKDKRKRALAWLAKIRARVQQFCGMVKETNGLIAEAQDAAKDIRELLEDPDLRSILPKGGKALLGSAADRLEQVESLLDRASDYASMPADVCEKTLDALDTTESLLKGRLPWQKLWDAIGGAKVAGSAAAVIGALAISAIVFNSGSDEPTVSNIFILSAPRTMEVGAEADMTVQVEGEGGTPVTDEVTVTYSSEDSSIVDVSPSGHLVAQSEGTASIIASAGERSASQSITVVPNVIAVAVSVSPNPVALDVGAEQTLTASVFDTSGRRIDAASVDWRSSDPSVAEVASDGTVTAVGEGSAEIFATSDGIENGAVVRVTATLLPDLTVTAIDVIANDCPAGAGCTVTASITIRNIGRGSSSDTTAYLETSNGLTGVVDVPSLTGGQQTAVRVVTDAGANCFSADCTLTAIVDPDDVVTEASEDNNSAETTIVG